MNEKSSHSKQKEPPKNKIIEDFNDTTTFSLSRKKPVETLTKKNTLEKFKGLFHRRSKSISNKSECNNDEEIQEKQPLTKLFNSDITIDVDNSLKNLFINPSQNNTPRRSSHSLKSPEDSSITVLYGKRDKYLGEGSFAIVRLAATVNSDKKYAVKEFRKKRSEEGQKDYFKKMIAEFCISQSLEHVNIVKTLDLIEDKVFYFYQKKHNWCVVMEFCGGGDLYSRIQKQSLVDINEINW